MKIKVLFGCLLVLLLGCSVVFSVETPTELHMQKHEVELYVTSWCGYCKQAKKFLDQRGITYQIYDVEKDAAAAKRKNEIAPHSGVPLAVIDGNIIRGWSKSLYQELLNK